MTKYSIKSYEDFQATDDDSIASEPEATPFEVMKIAAGEWNRMSSVLKKAWKDQCCAVNNLPIRGAFDSVPSELSKRLNEHVIQSLTLEFDHFCAFISQAMKTKTQIPDTVKWKTFGRERFALGNKICRSFCLTHLLTLTIFGNWQSFSKLASCEIVYRSRKTRVIHISSRHRLEEFFTLNGICPFHVNDDKNKKIYCSGGKVSVTELCSGKEGNGLIETEDQNGNITILLEVGDIIKLKKPRYLAEDGMWDFTHSMNDRYRIIQYDPIRIRILQSGNCYIVMNRFVLYTHNSNNMIRIQSL